WQQQHRLPVTELAMEHVLEIAEFCGTPSQHRSIPWRRASSTAYSGGRTPCSWAQSIRSASVWQQQERHHCSAEVQPQGQSMQGKVSPLLCDANPAGSGKPLAVTAYITSSIELNTRRPKRRRTATKLRQILRQEGAIIHRVARRQCCECKA